MKRSAVRAAVVVGSLAALVLGSASSQAQMKIGTGDPVADRQRLMKLNGASWKDVQDKVKAGNVPEFTFSRPIDNALGATSLESFRGRPTLFEFWGTY